MTEEEPWALDATAVGLPVWDVNGVTLGRVTRVDPAAGLLDVELKPRIARRYHAPVPIVTIPVDEVVDVDDHEVTLREAAAFVIHPEDVPREAMLGE